MTIEESCIICQDSITNSWTYTNCDCNGGCYHIYCLRVWQERSHSCPTCRREYNREEPDSDTTIHITLDRAIFMDSIGRYRSF